MSSFGMRIAAIIVAFIVIISIYFFWSEADEKRLPTPVSINTSDQPTLGDSSAKVHLVAFEDLKCGNCARFNNELLPQIKKQFVDTGIAKYTMINVAFIPGSMPAANAARCVYDQNPKAFFEYVDHIYRNQPPEDQNWATIPNLVSFAENLPSINKQKLSECIANSPYDSIIKRNEAMGMKVMDGQLATPTLYVNGHIVRPLTLENVEYLVNRLK